MIRQTVGVDAERFHDVGASMKGGSIDPPDVGCGEDVAGTVVASMKGGSIDPPDVDAEEVADEGRCASMKGGSIDPPDGSSVPESHHASRLQ